MKDLMKRMFAARENAPKITYKQYQHAFEAHHVWKTRLINVIQRHTHLEELHPDAWECHQGCQLGQWLRGDETRHLAEHPEFLKLLDTHEHFHHAAAKLLQLAIEHRGREVLFQMSRYGEFEAASLDLTRCLHRLHHGRDHN